MQGAETDADVDGDPGLQQLTDFLGHVQLMRDNAEANKVWGGCWLGMAAWLKLTWCGVYGCMTA